MKKRCFGVNQTNNRIIYWRSLNHLQRSASFWEAANRPPAANTGGNWGRDAAGCLRSECLSNIQL